MFKPDNQSNFNRAVLFARENPFEVHLYKDDKEAFLLLCGDKLKEGSVLAYNVFPFSESLVKERLEDLKKDYMTYTNTDGSKVDWTILTLNIIDKYKGQDFKTNNFE